MTEVMWNSGPEAHGIKLSSQEMADDVFRCISTRDFLSNLRMDVRCCVFSHGTDGDIEQRIQAHTNPHYRSADCLTKLCSMLHYRHKAELFSNFLKWLYYPPPHWQFHKLA
jgi:hypothetical protein